MNVSTLRLSTRPETASTACHLSHVALVSRKFGGQGDVYNNTPRDGSDADIVRAMCAPPAAARGIVGKDAAITALRAIRNAAVRYQRSSALYTLLLIGAWGYSAAAAIDGITGPNFELTAKEDYINRAGGDRAPVWGYASGNGRMQYPGPTLIVNQGDVVTVTLRNALPPRDNARPRPVSIVFPELESVTARGGTEGLLTREAQPTDNPATPENEAIVTYTFTASRPGTYLYHTGTRMDLDVEMGLVGTLIVRSDSDRQAREDRGKTMGEKYSSALAKLYRDLYALTH